MSRISGIIAFQNKKSNLERDLRKKTDIKGVTKGNPSCFSVGTSFSFTATLSFWSEIPCSTRQVL